MAKVSSTDTQLRRNPKNNIIVNIKIESLLQTDLRMDDSWIDGPEHISECGGCDSWCEACCDVNENAYQEWLKNEKAKVETQKEKDVLANLGKNEKTKVETQKEKDGQSNIFERQKTHHHGLSQGSSRCKLGKKYEDG